MMRPRWPRLKIYGVPLAVGIFSGGGLVMALLLEGRSEYLAVGAVACSLAVIGWVILMGNSK